ncbi:uncharacterized protein LOC123005339 isoform X2 [Tribolium madens]|uniref:uncharacterized protein LOC123005339 isoform X2 n=1 Tax=Tribolium madens TaxID=41895 RepID=UPI001CF72E17|nr:uncharacterized protein LOC123005339 isoform X2 [Tribolium madens]
MNLWNFLLLLFSRNLLQWASANEEEIYKSVVLIADQKIGDPVQQFIVVIPGHEVFIDISKNKNKYRVINILKQEDWSKSEHAFTLLQTAPDIKFDNFTTVKNMFYSFNAKGKLNSNCELVTWHLDLKKRKWTKIRISVHLKVSSTICKANTAYESCVSVLNTNYLLRPCVHKVVLGAPLVCDVSVKGIYFGEDAIQCSKSLAISVNKVYLFEQDPSMLHFLYGQALRKKLKRKINAPEEPTQVKFEISSSSKTSTSPEGTTMQSSQSHSVTQLAEEQASASSQNSAQPQNNNSSTQNQSKPPTEVNQVQPLDSRANKPFVAITQANQEKPLNSSQGGNGKANEPLTNATQPKQDKPLDSSQGANGKVDQANESPKGDTEVNQNKPVESQGGGGKSVQDDTDQQKAYKKLLSVIKSGTFEEGDAYISEYLIDSSHYELENMNMNPSDREEDSEYLKNMIFRKREQCSGGNYWKIQYCFLLIYHLLLTLFI